MKLQGHTAGCSDSLQHRERVPRVFSVLQAGDHGLCCADLLGKFGLSQIRIFSYLADQEGQVNPMQGAREGLSVGCALACALLDNLTVPVALDTLSHKPNSFRIASLSLCDPV